MQQRTRVLVLCGVMFAGPHLAEGAEQDAVGGRIGEDLGASRPAPSESNTSAIQSLGAPAVGTGSATGETADLGQNDCLDEIGATATGSDASEENDGTSAGESIGQGLRDASRVGCTSEGTSVGQALGAGTRAATPAIGGE